MRKESRLLKATSVLLALITMIFILYAGSITAHAVSGPRPSNEAGILVGFTRFGDWELIYQGNSKKTSADFEGFNYNKKTNTLTLNNIGNEDYYYLEVYDMGDDFKINVKGKNSLGYIAAYSDVKDRMNLTITGNGSLVINRDGAYGAAIHGYANGKSNTKITIDNTVNMTMYGGENIFTGKNEKVIMVENAKSSKQSDVFRIGGKKTGSTKVAKKKTKKGYTFSYGSTGKLVIKKSGKSFLGSKSSSSSTAKKAVTTYTVKYNLNGGKGSIDNQKKTKGKNLKLSTKKPTRSGYIFKGWSVKKDGTVKYDPGDTYKTDSNVTLYAKWKKKGKIYACVISGCNNKDNGYTVYAAQDIYKKLRNNKIKGYTANSDLIKIHNLAASAPAKHELDDFIASDFKKTTSRDISFVYYAGHGMGGGSNGNGRGIILRDIEKEDYSQYYGYKDFLEMLGNNINGKIVLITDMCYSGGFVKAVSKTSVKDRICILTSCAPNQLATSTQKLGMSLGWDWLNKAGAIAGATADVITYQDHRYQCFTYAFMKGLNWHKTKNYPADSNNDNAVTFKELKKYVKNHMPKSTDQTPNFYSGNLGDQILFGY